MKLVGLVSLFAGSALADCDSTNINDCISVRCNDDNTIDVGIEYSRTAEILELTYGTCNDLKEFSNTTQKADFGWDLNFDVTRCGMDSKLRTLDYNQTAHIRLGRKSGSQELTLADFDIDSFCSYTAVYNVTFNYGNLSTEAHSFDSTGGLIDLNFTITSYNMWYNESMDASTQGGDTIYLGLKVNNEGFDHLGKDFAPQSCTVSDTVNTLTYTLFDTASSCDNADVDLDVNWDRDSKTWQFAHTLFLLGNFRSSTFELSCVVIVCDASQSADCNAVVRACA